MKRPSRRPARRSACSRARRSSARRRCRRSRSTPKRGCPGLKRQRVAGQRRRDDGEVLGEQRDQLVELEHRARPAVREQQRHRVGSPARLVDEMQVDAADRHLELREAVELALPAARQSKPSAPVVEQAFHIGEAGARRPRRAAAARRESACARGARSSQRVRIPARSALKRRGSGMLGMLSCARSRSGKTRQVKTHLIRATASPPPARRRPGCIAFYWHFVRQTKGWYAAMFAASLAVALLDTVIPLFIGRLVSLMEATDRQAALAAAVADARSAWSRWCCLARPLVVLADIAIRHNALMPGATSLIRWQSHWHVVRQSWPFFQNDFAGRIANRVMQTANALRESAMSSIRAVWYIARLRRDRASRSWRWPTGGSACRRCCGSRATSCSCATSCRACASWRARARRRARCVMARVVDSYTNILTVKLFARLADEDAYVRESDRRAPARDAARTWASITRSCSWLTALNALLLVGTAAIGIWLWAHGRDQRRRRRHRAAARVADRERRPAG